MGSIHSNYGPFTEKGILVMPYISLTIKKNSKESLTTIFCTVIIYLYISFNRKCGRHDDTVTDSHKRELVFLCTELYRTPKSQVHKNDCDQN